MPSALAQLASERCGVYVWDIHNATGMSLPPKYVPRDWYPNKFSAEMWVQRAAQRHPWRVRRSEDADVVLLAANFSMYCSAGKQWSARFVWRKMLPLMGYTGKDTGGLLHAPALNGTETTPKLLVLTNRECQPPWAHVWKPPVFVMLTDHNAGKYDATVPFVVSRPPWLVGAAGAEPPAAVSRASQTAWSARRLLFFTGHVPKLYINPTRYHIWRQVRREPGVTALSATINCTVGSYAECRRELSDADLRTYCRPYCATHCADDLVALKKDQPGHKFIAKTTVASCYKLTCHMTRGRWRRSRSRRDLGAISARSRRGVAVSRLRLYAERVVAELERGDRRRAFDAVGERDRPVEVDPIVRNVEVRQRAVGGHHLGHRLRALVAQPVPPQVNAHEGRVALETVGDRGAALGAERVPLEVEVEQEAV